MLINKNSIEPIYVQIKKRIKQNIADGIYKHGDKILSERVLSEEFGVSRMTVRQAINDLSKEGILYKEKGRGTFVSSPKFYQKNIKSFTDTLEERGYIPSTEVLEFCTVHSLKEVNDLLGVSDDTFFYKIKRVRFADGIAVAVETVYMPKEYCPELDKYDVNKSLYKILKEEYGYSIESETCEISACISDKFQMKLFNVQNRIPLLKVSGVNIESNGKKLFYEDSYYRSDLYRYQVDIFKRVIM